MPEQTRRYLWIAVLITIVAAYIGFIANEFRNGFDKAARGDRPMFTDFTSTYGASVLLNHSPIQYVYHPELIVRATEFAANAAYGGTLSPQQAKVGYAPFMYPPTFMPLIMPLAHLPYFPAMIVWLALTAIPYLLAVRAALHGAPISTFVALASPPFFYNLMFGQTSFLPAGLIGLGLAGLKERPVLSGVLIGLASIKPHFGVLIPIALIAGGYWRSFVAAALTVIGMIVASLIAFGDQPWLAFIGISQFHLQGFEQGAFAWKFMPTVLGLGYLSGLTLVQAGMLQSLSFVLCNLLVGVVWYRGRLHGDSFDLQRAVLCLALPFAVPLLFMYDLVAIVPGLAFLISDMRRNGARRGEWGLLVAATASLLLIKPLGAVPGVPLTVAALFGMLALSIVRFHSRSSKD